MAVEVSTKPEAQTRQNGSALAVGTMQYTTNNMNYQNAVVNLTDYRIGAANIPFYAKNHLVPFGEYKPLPSLTAPLYQMMDMPLSNRGRFGRGVIGGVLGVLAMQRGVQQLFGPLETQKQ